jgi:hypothetical protein
MEILADENACNRLLANLFLHVDSYFITRAKPMLQPRFSSGVMTVYLHSLIFYVYIYCMLN